MSEALSLTHHTFVVEQWIGAGEGAVLVTQLDDSDSPVLLLKPDDVLALIDALQSAAAPPEAR